MKPCVCLLLRYFPGPQDKLPTIQLGVASQSMVRPVPEISLVPDYLDCPWGHIHERLTDKPSHLAFHPGMVSAAVATHTPYASYSSGGGSSGVQY